SNLPPWIDDTLHRALQINPLKRYTHLSEFTYDMRHPNKVFLAKTRQPLLQRDPLLFWQSLSFILFVIILVLLSR
ncbi:MAG: hypothetical protein ACI89W_002027, partial [Gammaproteobacteria bacterium]